MGKHEDPKSPKDEPLDPKKHQGQGSSKDHDEKSKGKHGGKGGTK